MALLAASILQVAGVDAGLWSMHAMKHAALAVTLDPNPNPVLYHNDTGDWYYVEMTNNHWGIGQVPYPSFLVGELRDPT